MRFEEYFQPTVNRVFHDFRVFWQSALSRNVP
jgi:hypothetical protein